MATRSGIASAGVALLACFIAVAVGTGLRAEQPAIRPAYQPVQSFSRPNGATASDVALHVAVVGAVRSPGVFRSGRTVTFAEAIDAAGGADGDASGTVQVVRQGRLLRGFYQPGAAPAPDQIGPLLDGDVVVLRPQRGVRTAHYVTTNETGRGSPTAVQHASRPQLVHVACVGISNRPVVLPLLPEEATQRTLLSDMLGLPATGVPQGAIVILPSAGSVPSDGSLSDGMVLLFDARKLDVRRLKPVEDYPPAREFPAARTESQSQAAPAETIVPAETPPVVTAAPAPGVPFMVYAEAATTPASQRSAQALAAPQQSLDSTASTGLAPSPFLRALETVAPPPMLGATSPLETGGQTPVDVTGASSGPALREIVVRGPHQPTSYERSEPASIRLPPMGRARPARIESSSVTVQDFPRDGTAVTTGGVTAPRSLVQVLPIAAATFVTALACLAGSYFWSRRTPGNPLPAATPAIAVGHAEADSRSSLDELLENRLPVTVDNPAQRLHLRFHGKTIGRKRLMIDPIHAGVERPHFDLAASASHRAARRERSEQHLAAALAPRRSRRDQATMQVESPTRYDVVEPETAAGIEPPPSTPRRRTVGTDALARALSSLQEDRT